MTTFKAPHSRSRPPVYLPDWIPVEIKIIHPALPVGPAVRKSYRPFHLNDMA